MTKNMIARARASQVEWEEIQNVIDLLALPEHGQDLPALMDQETPQKLEWLEIPDYQELYDMEALDAKDVGAELELDDVLKEFDLDDILKTPPLPCKRQRTGVKIKLSSGMMAQRLAL